MTTISIKLPEDLDSQVEAEAKRRHVSKSAVVRECLKTGLSRTRKRLKPSVLDLMGRLAGSQPGPRDASTNKAHMKGFGE